MKGSTVQDEGRTMRLAEVLAGASLKTPLTPEWAGLGVAGLEYDSRRIAPGYLFFAFPGQRHDGRHFAAQALERGAVAVVSEGPAPQGFPGPWLEVEHGRKALAIAALNFYGHPDRRLALTGVTGTNGKTTTTFLLDAMLRAAGRVTALLGTIEHRVAERAQAAVNTTPESLDLVRWMDELLAAGGTHVTMEVSSHGLALARVYGFQFHTAVFTNLSQDHLDFHRTMEEYFAAKRRLFEGAGAPPPHFAVINADDPYSGRLPLPDPPRVFTYGLAEGARVRATDIVADFRGVRFRLSDPRGVHEVASALPGRMNVYNILAAWSAALTYDLPAEALQRGIAACRTVPGRFEKVEAGQPFLVVVDYAHTEDALRNVIRVARELGPKRVLTLFGCGGDRDPSKRPRMGEAAAAWSDFVVLTSDNPRSEDPLSIIEDALEGLRRHSTPYCVEPDRARAIRLILEQARPGDIVIIAGKGHETYQVLKDRTIPFDDREVARRALGELGYPGEHP
jgi:UDP-N-acetylmuramoyl-L-alanyl-D-glutamate--2,6-diaminopimelate ligase